MGRSRKRSVQQRDRQGLGRAALLVEIDEHVYVRCGEAGDGRRRAETVGEGLVAAFRLSLNRMVRSRGWPCRIGRAIHGRGDVVECRWHRR
ncbi:hypothetical protein WKI68_44260 [Streptomyces sp. MS1.HAVA.3]|uniref:Transposase n=1 Tax=Streptomyces caledonius TaxID=3134107 RepID=A0ABU8UES6_9ACTN